MTFDRETFDDVFAYRNGELIVDENGVISCTGDLRMINPLAKLPFQFGKVYGSVNFGNSELETLEGSPSEIGDDFVCNGNKIQNLMGGPKKSLSYYARNNKLTSLIGLPEYCSLFSISYNENLGLLRIFYIKELNTLQFRQIGLSSNNSNFVESLISDIYKDKKLNTQQKILTAKRELISSGYEGNARL